MLSTTDDVGEGRRSDSWSHGRDVCTVFIFTARGPGIPAMPLVNNIAAGPTVSFRVQVEQGRDSILSPKSSQFPRDINKLTLPISAIFSKLELIDRKFGMIFGSVLNGGPVALCNFLSLKRTIGLVESLQG